MIAFLSVVKNEKVWSILEQAYYLYRNELIRKANDILHDEYEAEDIVQTAFIKFSDYIDENIDIKCHKTPPYIVIYSEGWCCL